MKLGPEVLADPRDNASYQPFDDGREIRIRRDDATYRSGGLSAGQQTIVIGDREVVLRRFRWVLSPPALAPGQQPFGDDGSYTPISDFVTVGGRVIQLPRRPRGFTDDEVRTIIAGLLGGPRVAPVDVFARLADPDHEVRRCAACGEPAVICDRTITHYVNGQRTGAVTRECRCQACGVKITLYDPRAIRSVKIVALLFVFTVIPPIVIWLEARSRKRTWIANPLVPAAPRPKRRYPPIGIARRCVRCATVVRGQAHTTRPPTGTTYRFRCTQCRARFATESIFSHVVRAVIAVGMAVAGWQAVHHPDGSRDRYLGALFLGLAALVVVTSLRRMVAAVRNRRVPLAW